MFAFEFGADTDEEARRSATSAFFTAASALGCQVGKCHSSFSSGPTSVTISVFGTSPVLRAVQPVYGDVYISRPLGAIKLHFLNELGLYSSLGPQKLLRTSPDSAFLDAAAWSALTDISGDGLAGALLSVSSTLGVDVDVNLSVACALAPEVLTEDVDCLLNPLDSYMPLSVAFSAPVASQLSRLRETAGPFLGFVNVGQMQEEKIVSQGAIRLGTFTLGTGKVRIGWQD